jgi:hypothetical protein
LITELETSRSGVGDVLGVVSHDRHRSSSTVTAC